MRAFSLVGAALAAMGVCPQGRRPSGMKARLKVAVWVLHTRARVEIRDELLVGRKVE